ncbi:hypothetical protein GA076_23795 [Vibrio parahaemolyticus]|uniref:hypothetical protein n=2 Tax=Vibrio parahaemolyticus TaxID=670 RepID=UPI0011240546|nr:hypothetical protein [Vibrio parahaemolyticus]EMA2414983.1 hypothetical protein [Vibrio vulnificus]EGU9031257.1 hypothetical protein [Vibrio parahaemolyticus]EIO4605648.1 hypothetical protein [Vibrio parahaemolyticus]EJC7008980.1 hypothetical protein [Vibrio parahaemolyticus]EJC7027184.1 hypothetical protein [Vibrio parahaemolyticus]
MFDEEVVIEIYEWYENIESRLSDVVGIVPLSSEKDLAKIHSPRLVSIIIETCSVIDTLLRAQMPERFKRPGAKGREMTRNGANIYDYHRELESTLKLTESKSVLLKGKPLLLCPFEKWSSTSNSSPMAWWRVYNRLKHNRIESSKEANLLHCVNALCALKQVMTKIPDVMRLSLRFNWVQDSTVNPEILLPLLHKVNECNYLAYTEFFATFLMPVELGSIDQIRPRQWGNHNQLSGHIGRW